MLARAAPRARMATARPRSVASLGPVFRAVRRQPRAAQCFRLMHDDFAPKSKTVPDTSILDQIQEQVDQKEVVLYMKGVPAQPQCGFSNMVVKILEMEGVEDYTAYNIMEDEELREGIKKFSDWPTIPQLYLITTG